MFDRVLNTRLYAKSNLCHRIRIYGLVFDVKVNKSVCTAKSRQRHDITLNDFLLHLRNHTLRDLLMLN